jgi:2-haloacid dehalogenase
MVKVIAFDVFGTVVDWHGSIARHVDAIGLGVDGSRFAQAWRAGYLPAMDEVRQGKIGWTRIDDLHRRILDRVLAEFGIPMSETERRALNLIWHRLDPWPDSVAGLTELKRRYTICTLSNGNIGLLTDLAKHAGLPWDCVLSAENFRHYKPDPETYLGVCDLFQVPPEQMLMVAAHKGDLQAAKACGCRTAFIERPYEYGTDEAARARKDLSRDPAHDFHARDLLDLARQLHDDPTAAPTEGNA